MRKKHILTIATTAAATLGLTAALGFRQPDGIDPPPGPAMDTQPSLASIDAKLDSLNFGDCNESLTVVATPRLLATELFTLQGGDIYLVRMHAIHGRFTVRDAAGLEFTIAAGHYGGERTDPIEFNFGVVLHSPITLTAESSEGSEATLIYKELP